MPMPPPKKPGQKDGGVGLMIAFDGPKRPSRPEPPSDGGRLKSPLSAPKEMPGAGMMACPNCGCELELKAKEPYGEDEEMGGYEPSEEAS